MSPATAGQPERGGGHDRARHEGTGEARAAQLLHERQGVGERGAAAAVLRGDQQAGPAQGRDLLPEVGREAARVERQLLHPLGRAALQEERARRLLQERLRGGEGEIHRDTP